jgi:type II secretory pathway component PulK
LDHPEQRLNLNTTEPGVLRQLLGRDDLTEALLDWRDADDIPRSSGAESAWYASERRPTPRNGPLASVDELFLVRGFDSAAVARLRPLVTTDGNGRLDLNTAPLALLALLPGMGPEAVETIASRRPLIALDGLFDGMSGSALAELLHHRDALQRQISFGVSEYVVEVVGGIEGTPILATARVVLVPTARRLAVVRVEAS